MAAYAALLSLMHIIEKIERHPSPPISLHKYQVESLTEKLKFLQEFLEIYHSPFDYSDEADPLEVRIADAAHAAEDVLEIKIVDRIHSRSTILRQVANFSKLSHVYKCAGTRHHFNHDLQKVIKKLGLIKKDVMNMVREKAAVEPQFHGNVCADVDGERNGHEMVGCDDVLLQLLDRLTGGESSRQIILVVGMGGIGYGIKLPYSSSRLLRTMNMDNGLDQHSLVDLLQFVNARYIYASGYIVPNTGIPSSISRLWNLHTLIISSGLDCVIARMKIWKMPQLRYVEFPNNLEMTKPPSSKDDDDIVVMENLHTLKGVYNLELNEEVVKRIPNIKKLRIYYDDYDEHWESRGVNCICNLHCLQNLYLNTFYSTYEAYLEKKFTLQVSYSCEVDDMLPKIDLLTLLQKLTLIVGVFGRGKWETSEGQFPSIKFLSLSHCCNLENWTVSESSHFPRLQELRLVQLLRRTLEIPSEIGEIATLKNIVVEYCSESVVLSAKKIADEQEDCGDLHVRARVRQDEAALQSLGGPNFQVQV